MSQATDQTGQEKHQEKQQENLQSILREFEAKLRRDIPLINQMGFQQLAYDGRSLRIHARLAPNVNDKGTAFAGALSATTTLCGWGLTTLSLAAEPKAYDVVIRDSHLEYLLPVTEDFVAECELPDEAEVQGFLERLREKGKARLNLVVNVKEHGQVAMRLTGAYVALEKRAWV